MVYVLINSHFCRRYLLNVLYLVYINMYIGTYMTNVRRVLKYRKWLVAERVKLKVSWDCPFNLWYEAENQKYMSGPSWSTERVKCRRQSVPEITGKSEGSGSGSGRIRPFFLASTSWLILNFFSSIYSNIFKFLSKSQPKKYLKIGEIWVIWKYSTALFIGGIRIRIRF